jgi:hypothetical protein
MKSLLLITAMLSGAAAVTSPTAATREVTWTGWFSDGRCARTPAPDELVTPNGTACVKRCLDEGSTPVFLSEQANAIFEVRDHAGVKDDVGYRVEIVGIVDEKATSISVRSVKRLSEVTALCLLPKKKG